MKRIFLVIFLLLALAVHHKQPIQKELIPASVLNSFLDSHPTATSVQYSLAIDDAWVTYVMHFEEDGQKQEAEYDYSASAMARDDALAAQYHEDVDHIGTQDEGFRKTGF
jgi:hypothetical protein